MEQYSQCEKNAIKLFNIDRTLNFTACTSQILTKGTGDIDIRCFSKLMDISRTIFFNNIDVCQSELPKKVKFLHEV